MLAFIILISGASAGAYLGGFTGALMGGMAGLISIILLAFLIQVFQGGTVPRSVRVKTALDFVQNDPSLIKACLVDHSTRSAVKEIEKFLNSMVKKSMENGEAFNAKVAMDKDHMLDVGHELLREKYSGAEYMLYLQLLYFLEEHPLWFGGR